MSLLNELPRSLYIVFNMAVIEGYNHREISETLGISERRYCSSVSRYSHIFI